MDPIRTVFREINYSRFKELKEAGNLSDETLASICRDQTGKLATAQKIANWLEVNEWAGEQMFVTAKMYRLLLEDAPSDKEHQPT